MGCVTMFLMKERHGHRPSSGASPTYTCWKNLRARCLYPNNPRFKRYGGRGIKFCDRWRSFKAFLEDMGERPSVEHSIERKNNDGHYEPGNCIWATDAEQQRNRSNNRLLTFNGRTQCVTDWAIELGVEPRRLFNRLARGQPIDQVLNASLGSRWPKQTRAQHESERALVERHGITKAAKMLGVNRSTIRRRQMGAQ